MGWHVHLLKHIKNLQLTNELEVFVFYYNIALLAKIIKIYMINKIFSNHFNPLIIVRSTLFVRKKSSDGLFIVTIPLKKALKRALLRMQESKINN